MAHRVSQTAEVLPLLVHGLQVVVDVVRIDLDDLKQRDLAALRLHPRARLAKLGGPGSYDAMAVSMRSIRPVHGWLVTAAAPRSESGRS